MRVAPWLVVLVLPFVLAAVSRPGGAKAEAPLATVYTYRAFVPAMAADSGTEPAGHVGATHLAQRVDGGLVVTGEVANHGAGAVAEVLVRVSLSRGGIVSTVETRSLVDVIPPGGTGPFTAFFAGVSDTTGSVSADILGFEPASGAAPAAAFTFSGPFPFQVGPPDPKTNVIPYSTVLEQLRGTITNTGETALAEMEVLVVAYDGVGNVVFVTHGTEPTVPFQEAGEAALLPPGQTASFVAGVPIGLLNTFNGEVTLKGFLNAGLG